MSTQVWTLIIDRESDEGHGVEVFASYREALAVLPARLPHEWGRYVHHQLQHELGYDEAHFLDSLGSLDFLDSAPEVVIEGHELEAPEVPDRLAFGEAGRDEPLDTPPDADRIVGLMGLHELRALARGALGVAAAYGQDVEVSGGDVMDALVESLPQGLPSWVPPINDSEDVASMNWWRRVTGKEPLPEDEELGWA